MLKRKNVDAHKHLLNHHRLLDVLWKKHVRESEWLWLSELCAVLLEGA